MNGSTSSLSTRTGLYMQVYVEVKSNLMYHTLLKSYDKFQNNRAGVGNLYPVLHHIKPSQSHNKYIVSLKLDRKWIFHIEQCKHQIPMHLWYLEQCLLLSAVILLISSLWHTIWKSYEYETTMSVLLSPDYCDFCSWNSLYSVSISGVEDVTLIQSFYVWGGADKQTPWL